MDRAASNDSEFRAICDAETSSFIRSDEDWKRARRERSGVLSKLSESALDEWEKEVEFKNGGLAHGSYAEIKKEIGDEGVDQFLELFGLGAKLAGDRKDMYCESRGTCGTNESKVCTENCHGGGGGSGGGSGW